MSNIKKLARKNNYETLFRQLTEEAAELIVAIQKYKRSLDENCCNLEEVNTKYNDMLKEIADVQVCIDQLMSKDEDDTIAIERYKEQKILRQLKRFEIEVEGIK